MVTISCPWCGKKSDHEIINANSGESDEITKLKSQIADLELDISALQIAHGKALQDLTTEKTR